jgi:GNAT superfamily N-acetyltransferase
MRGSSAGERIELIPVEDAATRAAAAELLEEYLRWIGRLAEASYGLSIDVAAMVASDLDDRAKFYPPSGRFYVVRHANAYVGIGCLKRLAPGVAEIQRMYVRPQARRLGAGRRLVERLLGDARAIGYRRARLESLKALPAAHALYRSVGFVEIPPYAENSMQEYQPARDMERYRASAVFMELELEAALREARAGDIAGMHRVRLAVRENRLTSSVITEADYVAMIEEHGRGWVVEEAHEIVGFAVGDARDGNIWALFVHPQHERRGHGRRLHDAMVSWLASRGLARLWLTTQPGTRAQRFYEAAGWRPDGETNAGSMRYILQLK